MTKSEIFRKAHALTKSAIRAGDDYRATFGAALKSLMSEPVDALKALTAAGGTLWEKSGMRRIYFNNLAALMGLSISYYKTGNISSARHNGERISNGAAGRMLSSIDKLWFDLADNKFYFKASDKDLARTVCAKLRAVAGI